MNEARLFFKKKIIYIYIYIYIYMIFLRYKQTHSSHAQIYLLV
jgi:uncharacterized membrane protein SirB2